MEAKIKNNNGFSLIELMVVIAIVAVLSAVAVPSYKAYTVRAKVSAALPLLNAEAIKLIETYNKTGATPAASNVVVNDLSSASAGSINQIYTYGGCGTTYTTGLCTQVFANFKSDITDLTGQVNTRILLLVFYDVNGVTKVYCGTDSRVTLNLPTQYLPGSCVPNIFDGTNILAGYP